MSPVACSLIKDSPHLSGSLKKQPSSGARHLSQPSLSAKVFPTCRALFSPRDISRDPKHIQTGNWETVEYEKSDPFLYPHVFFSSKELVQITTEFYSPKGAKANQLHNHNHNKKSLLQQNVGRASAVAPSRQLSTSD